MAASSVDERAALTATDAGEAVEQEMPNLASRRRRLVVGGAVGVGVASALILWRSLSKCEVERMSVSDGSLVSLAATYPQDLVIDGEEDDVDSRKQWLAEASEARAKLNALPAKGRVPKEVQKELDDILATDDPEKARKLVDRAVERAVEESKVKRKSLKKYLKAHRRSLKGEYSYDKQIAITYCVFDALDITTTIAGIAANMNDAAKTCWGVNPADLFRFGLQGKAWVHTNVCSVNVWAVLGSVVGLSTSLSNIASDCAATLMPNVNAYCAATVTGLVTAVAGMGGAATLVKAACMDKGWYHDIDMTAVPSNVGSNDKWITNHPERQEKYEKEQARLKAGLPPVDPAAPPAAPPAPPARRLEEGPAPARQLLFGGGKGSTATQCTIEIANTLWSLASAALAINNAANIQEGGNCPPKNFLTGSTRPSNSILYRVPQALCTVDISSVLLSTFAAVTYIQLAAVNCVDTLSLGLICGSGLTGLMAAAAGVAKAGAGMYITCDVAQKKPIKRTYNFARNVDKATSGMLSDTLMNMGRRLNEDEQLMVSIAEDDIRELKKHFKSPHDALLSVGIDLENEHAPWRNMTGPAGTLGDVSHLVSLMQQPERAASLFGGSTCQ